MAPIKSTSREALIEILDDLQEERVISLLDYAEYLLSKQAEEDAADLADSARALKDGNNIPWDIVKQEIDDRVQTGYPQSASVSSAG